MVRPKTGRNHDRALKSGAGPTFWDQKMLTLARLEDVERIASRIPNLAINVCFMLFAGLALAFNIVTR
jgi:ethanolaminephosphotransferase